MKEDSLSLKESNPLNVVMIETLTVCSSSNPEDTSVPPQASDCSSLLLELHIIEEAASLGPVSRSTSSETSQSSSSYLKTHSDSSVKSRAYDSCLPVSCVNNSQTSVNTVVRVSSPVPADSTSVTVPESPTSAAQSSPEVIKSSNQTEDVKSPVMNVKISSPSVERKSTVPVSSSHVIALKSSEAKSLVPDPVPVMMTPPAPPVSTLTLTPKTSRKKLESSESDTLRINPVCPKPQLEVSSYSPPLTSSYSEMMMVEGLENEGPESSWMKDSVFSEASDVSLDLPILQPSAVERLSASGQV